MAIPPDLSVPAWATWGTLAALALLSTLAGTVGHFLGKAPADRRQDTWGHVSELRVRLVRIVLALSLTVALAFLLRITPTAPFVAVDPYENLSAQVFRRMATDLVPPDVQLVVTSPTEGFVAMFNVALGIGLLVSLPYLLSQVGGFVWPALRPRERRMLGLALGPATFLFALGALFAYAFLLPSAFEALYAFSAVLGAEGLLQVGEFVGFTVMLMLVAGAAFLTPLVMVALARAGLATPRGYVRYWRHTVVAVVLVGAIVTPDPTPVSQLLVAGPLVALYFLGALLSVPASRAFARNNP